VIDGVPVVVIGNDRVVEPTGCVVPLRDDWEMTGEDLIVLKVVWIVWVDKVCWFTRRPGFSVTVYCVSLIMLIVMRSLFDTIEADWKWLGETVIKFAFAIAGVPEHVIAYSM
jgi:hypothetical protein